MKKLYHPIKSLKKNPSPKKIYFESSQIGLMFFCRKRHNLRDILRRCNILTCSLHLLKFTIVSFLSII